MVQQDNARGQQHTSLLDFAEVCDLAMRTSGFGGLFIGASQKECVISHNAGEAFRASIYELSTIRLVILLVYMIYPLFGWSDSLVDARLM